MMAMYRKAAEKLFEFFFTDRPHNGCKIGVQPQTYYAHKANFIV
jgi:hypothetical protein